MIFTIAIPTYNNCDIIEKAIGSALNQDYKGEYEILVVDNCSTDNTSLILDAYRTKISVIKNLRTVTLIENHNVCLEHAKGEYIIYCHSDDELLPDALTKYFNILENRNFPSKYVLWGRSMFRDFGNSWGNGGFSLNQIASGIESIEAFKGGGLTPSGTCYSRKTFLEIGGFLKVTHRLQPSDLITMWKLAFCFFEFEMTDRIFFNREFASTAIFDSENDVYDSLVDAIQVFKQEVSGNKVQIVVGRLTELKKIFNPILIKVLIDEKLITKKMIRKKMIKIFLKNPLLLYRKQYLKLLF
jgi:glycosyltransferase involved in cell wall biosynthesis